MVAILPTWTVSRRVFGRRYSKQTGTAAASAELCRTSKRTKSHLFTTVRRGRELKDAVRLQLPSRNVADATILQRRSLIPQRQSLP
jgi:hypothetical protein